MSEIEACRTCGIFFLVTSNFLRHLFGSEPEMLAVRRELEAWNIKLNEDDRFPQYICTVCLLEFRKILKFQQACLETQDQLRQLYAIQQDNIKKIKIKTELSDDIFVKKEPEYKSDDIDQQNVCTFIYIDDLSDSEYDSEKGNGHNVPKFKVPHIPIKEEIIEEARVPLEHIPSKNTDDHQRVEQMSVLALTQNQLPVTTDEVREGAMNEQSNITNGIQCELCMHVSMDQQEHRQHLLRIHESKSLACHICGKEFKAGTTQTRFKYHLKWHRLNKHIKCPQCGFHCASRNVLNEHTRAVHIKTACEICGKRVLPKKMRLHMEEHPLSEIVEAPIKCPYCLTDFSNEVERDQHIVIAHTEENRNLDSLHLEEKSQDSIMESGSENETANSITTVSTSMRFSTDDRSEIEMPLYSMENESYDFEIESEDSYETSLENEMSTVNLTASALDEMQFTCAQCPMSFSKVEHLIAHAEVHQEKSLFCCNVCGKKFDLKFSLNRHMKRHKNVTC